MLERVHSYLRKKAKDRFPIDWAAEIARHPAFLHEVLKANFENPVIRNLYEDSLYKGPRKLKLKLQRFNALAIGAYLPISHTVIFNSFHTSKDKEHTKGLSDTFAHELRHAWQGTSGVSKNIYFDPFSQFIKSQIMEMDAFAFSEFSKVYPIDKKFALRVYRDIFLNTIPNILNHYGEKHFAFTYSPLPIPPTMFGLLSSAVTMHAIYGSNTISGLIGLSVLGSLPAYKFYRNRYQTHEHNPNNIRFLLQDLTFKNEDDKVEQLLNDQDIELIMDKFESIYQKNEHDSHHVRNVKALILRIEDAHKFPAGKYIAPLIV